MMKTKPDLLVGAVLLLGTVLLTACGGGSGGGAGAGGDGGGAGATLSGTAAAGAPIVGQVTVKGAQGNTKSALIAADGSYRVDVTGLTAPFRLRAEGTVGGRTIRLHSYAEEADMNGTVNITPFTDLIVANAAQQVASSFFDSQTVTTLDAAVIAEQEAALQDKLQEVFDAMGVDAAVDLLRTSFSADHSGLDAALDAVRVEVDTSTNVATITNLIENSSITDSILDTTDNTAVLAVADSGALTGAVTDTQAIAAIFARFTQAFAAGLPDRSTIQDLFAADFYSEDTPKSAFLTDITTDPGLVGLTLSGVAISDLDPVLGTAQVTFHVGKGGYVDPMPNTWFAARDNTLGWQVRGDQRIADMYFEFHCNDNDGDGIQVGACGINTRFWDNDFTNNGTASNAPVASGTVSIIDGTNSANVKAVIYLGTPPTSAPGDVQVYDEASRSYMGDWKAFGTGVGQIDPAILQAGDVIEYKLYTQDLDLSTPAAPRIAAGAVAVASYQDRLLFAPSTTGEYPTATAATLTAMSSFTLGNSLAIGWTLANDTLSDEILVKVSDAAGNSIEVWDSAFAPDATSATIASTQLDAAAASNAGLDGTAASYTLLVRIYALDPLTGQFHSTDYSVAIPGPGATTGDAGPVVAAYACSYQSGWDDAADGGLGAPITPNSFADYEAVVADCGTAMAFSAADVAGKTFQESGTIEAMTFNAGIGTATSPATGSYDDGAGTVFAFQWYVEAATCSGCNYNYLVIYTDTAIEPGLPLAWLRETTALTGITGIPGAPGALYSFVKYSEQSNYSDSARASGSDGEIWHSVDQLQ